MHFTGIKPLNLPHYLFRSLVKITEKVQRKGRDHQESLFHHGLVKIIVLHQLSQVNISWETFMQSTTFLPTTSQPTSQSTPSTPSRPQEVGSSNKFLVRKKPRADITQSYKKGKRLVFAPKITKEVSTPKTLTRSQSRQFLRKLQLRKFKEKWSNHPSMKLTHPCSDMRRRCLMSKKCWTMERSQVHNLSRSNKHKYKN